MKTHQSINGTGSQNTGNHCNHNDLAWRPRATAHVLAVVILCVAASGTAQVGSSNNLGPDNWVAIGDGIRGANGEVIHVVTDGAGNVYVAGNFTAIGDVAANYIAKWDGRTWSALGSGMDDQVATLAVSGTTVYAGGIFTTAGGVEVNMVAKWDGNTWSALSSGVVGTEVSEVAVMGGTLYAGGLFSDAGGVPVSNIAKWDGDSWSPLGSGVDSWVSSMEVSGDDLFVGGRFQTAGGVESNLVAKWDGSNWSSLSGLGYKSYYVVQSLRMFGSDLYAGGNFHGATDYIAKWDGSEWTPVGLGVDAEIRGMAVSADALYVGGNFTTAGGIPANHIAKWDGTSWSALGSGTIKTPPEVGGVFDKGIAVRTIALVGDTVYAGGDFVEADGQAVNHIAQWNGDKWSTVGSASYPGVLGRDGVDVRVLAVAGDDIYVGGNFTALGDLDANAVAKWDGKEWSALGMGLERDDPFHIFESPSGFLGQPPTGAMEVSGSNLYVSGDFTTAGGQAANHIAKWDGESWSTLGNGLSGPADVLVMSGPDLYAGGDGIIAKWDGVRWSTLGGGVNGEVFAILVDGSDVYVGGDFTRAGVVEAMNLAKWDGDQWMSLGRRRQDSDSEFRVTDMVKWRSDLYIAGAGLNRTIFRWDGVNWMELHDPAEIPGEQFGQVPSFVPTAEGFRVLSYRFRDKSAYPGLVETTLSEWDGSGWVTVPIAVQTRRVPHSGRLLSRLCRHLLPVSTISGGNLYVGDHNVVVGGKVSPLISRFFLGTVPPLEVGDGQASVFFREDDGVKPGRVHQIERTTAFETWEVLGTRYAGQTGGIDFTDNDAPEGQAFYRAVPVTEE